MTTPTPKISSRSRMVARTAAGPSLVKSPPLTTSNNINTPHYPFLDSSPSHFPAKEGGVKLKIKSTTTPEARSRVVVKPSGARSLAPASTLASRALHRAITPSDSEGSLAGIPAAGHSDDSVPAPGMDHDEEPLGETEAVLVTVRVRPPNTSELQSRDPESIWTTPHDDEHLIKLEGGRDGTGQNREWLFDRILPPESDNAQAYNVSARAHVRSAMEGFNAVVFAYGQTASGKTFTLSGSPSSPGIIPLAVSDLFAQIRFSPDREFLLRASYIELYNETILDLLGNGNGKELSLSEGKKKGEVVINGLTECGVRTEEEVRRLLRVGEDRRKVGGTDWNQRSSRSHCVFRIVIESRQVHAPSATPVGSRTPGGRLKSAGEKMTRISTLSIIDLAGSERHTSSKERNAEGKHINQSLLTLKQVISKLADMASKRNVTHIPYRDSKLTRLLQPSLSGDALISVICTVSPAAINVAESLSTLSFAQGLKRVVLRAQKKEVLDPQALIQQYQNEIAELKALLREKDDNGSQPGAGKAERQKNDAMESRLNELRSLILTSVNVKAGSGSAEARPLSPTKLRYPKLDLDKSAAELREDLHASELSKSHLEKEVVRLRAELESRPRNRDQKIVDLQEEINGLKMIAADYERHLREPSRKVREDVEREYAGELSKIKNALESKHIWANRLDENLRSVTAENKALSAQLDQIIDWVNANVAVVAEPQPIPTSDFSPAPRMARAQFSHMDLASFNDRFGSLTMNGRKRTAPRLIREESGTDFAGALGEGDESF